MSPTYSAALGFTSKKPKALFNSCAFLQQEAEKGQTERDCFCWDDFYRNSLVQPKSDLYSLQTEWGGLVIVANTGS